MAHKAHKAHKGHKGHKARLTSGATKQFVSSNFWIQRKCVCTALEPGYSLQQALLSTHRKFRLSQEYQAKKHTSCDSTCKKMAHGCMLNL